MISIKTRLIFAALVVQSMAATAATFETPATPYSGQETRSIKALAEQEVAGLLAGQGAGLAKAAELNGYPGPAHTLELASQLELDAGQLGATRRLMADHQARAQHLGAEVVAAGQVRRYNVLRGYATPDDGAVPAAANPAQHGTGHHH